MSFKSQDILKKQVRLGYVLGGGAICLFLFFGYLMSIDESPKIGSQDRRKKVDLPGDSLDAQEAWMIHIDQEIKLMRNKNKILENQVLSAKSQEERKVKENEKLQKEVYRLNQKIISLSSNFDKGIKESPKTILVKEESSPFKTSGIIKTSHNDSLINEAKPRKLQEIILRSSKREKVKHVEKSIPAGTTVKALLVSSLDAPCSVYSSSDPHPVKLRILDDSQLPKKVRVKLKGSLVIGSAFGNISSERVQIRLERITQNKPDGSFVETQVTGYVTGEDGKYGVRGVVVDRSDQLVKSAAYTGFFSGLSQFFSSTVAAQSINQATQGLPNDVKWDVLKQSGGQGVSNAFDKLSEYYINRAEQLQPVIQVAAGRIVDITFSHGCEVGDLHSRKNVEKVREENRGKNA